MVSSVSYSPPDSSNPGLPPPTALVSSTLLTNRVSKSSSISGLLFQTVKKVGIIAAKGLLLVGCWVVVHGVSCILVIPGLIRFKEWRHRKKFQDDLVDSRLEAFKRGININFTQAGSEVNFSNAVNSLDTLQRNSLTKELLALKTATKSLLSPKSEADKKKFVNNALKLVRLIRDPIPPYRSYQEQERRIKHLMSSLARSPIYEANKDNTDNLYIQLIQALAAEVYVGANGDTAFKDMGEKEIGQFQPFQGKVDDSQMSTKNLKEALDKAVISSMHLSHNKPLARALHILVNPVKAIYNSTKAKYLEREKCNLCASQNGYNTWGIVRQGQPGNAEFVHTLGPAVVGNPIYDLYLDFLGNHGSFTIRHDLQTKNESEAAEAARVDVLIEKSERRSGQLVYYKTDMDSKFFKEEAGNIWGDGSLEAFFDKYKKWVKDSQQGNGDKGYYFSPKALSGEELDLVLNSSEKFLMPLVRKELNGKTLAHLSPEERTRYSTRYSRMIQFATQGFMSVAVLSKQLERKKEPDAQKKTGQEDPELQRLINTVSFGQACKEDIDRGVAHNILTKFLFKALNNEALTKKDVCEMAGVTDRALMVNHRKMLLERYLPLSSFLGLMGEGNEAENNQNLRESLTSLIKDIHNLPVRLAEVSSNSPNSDDGDGLSSPSSSLPSSPATSPVSSSSTSSSNERLFLLED